MWHFHSTCSQARNTDLIHVFPYLHWKSGTGQVVQLYFTREVEERFEILSFVHFILSFFVLNNFILQSVDKRGILCKSLPEPKGDKWENPHRFGL